MSLFQNRGKVNTNFLRTNTNNLMLIKKTLKINDEIQKMLVYHSIQVCLYLPPLKNEKSQNSKPLFLHEQQFKISIKWSG